MDFNTVVKSIINLEEINSKTQYSKNIEIQLYGNNFSVKKCKEYFNIITKTKANIVTVHMPINVDDFACLDVEYITNPNYKHMFINICDLCQELAIFYNHDINIIIHSGLCLEKYIRLGTLLENIIYLFNEVLTRNPNIKFSIENVLPIEFRKTGIYNFDGYLFDNVALANYLNENCKRKAFYTTIDICHMLYSIKLLDLFKNENFYNQITMKDFLDKNKNTLNNIHVNNLTNWGWGNYEHGSAFDKDNEKDIILLKEFFTIYKNLKLDTFITLEVCEEDYLNCINLRKTLESLNIIQKELQ